MSKKRLLLLLSLCMYAQWAVAQIHIILPEVSDEGLESWDRFPLLSPDSFLLNTFTFPPDFSASDTTYSVLTFSGSRLAPENDSLYMLWGDIKKGTPFFIIDKNQNNDFSDDSLLRIMPGDSSVFIHLNPHEHPENTHSLVLWFEKNISQADYEFTFRMLAPPYLRAGRKPIPARYWPVARRLVARIGTLEYEGETFKVGVYDGNFSGVYGDSPKDIVAMANLESNLKFRRSLGGVSLDSNATIIFQGKAFELNTFTPDGSTIELNPIATEISEANNIIPAMKVRTLSRDSAFLDAFVAETGFTVFYFWGPWCGGCVAQGPIFRKWVAENEEVKSVGLAKGFEQNIKAYCSKHNVTADQIVVNKELVTFFMADHYPQYILVDASKKIISRDMSMDELKAYVQKRKKEK
jgi:thiol-disulfide isomerase/thioredoxin